MVKMLWNGSQVRPNKSYQHPAHLNTYLKKGEFSKNTCRCVSTHTRKKHAHSNHLNRKQRLTHTTKDTGWIKRGPVI